MLTAICKGNREPYKAYEGDIEHVSGITTYVTDSAYHAGLHEGMGKDAGIYADSPQYDDRELDENELFVVKYYDAHGRIKIDMGLTKEEIIDNVIDNKYCHGAEYWTFGNMLKTTHDHWRSRGYDM